MLRAALFGIGVAAVVYGIIGTDWVALAIGTVTIAGVILIGNN